MGQTGRQAVDRMQQLDRAACLLGGGVCVHGDTTAGCDTVQCISAANAAYNSAISTGAASMHVINPLKPSGHYIYRQFNITQLYVLPTQLYLCVLCGSQNKQPLFPYTTLTDWFV